MKRFIATFVLMMLILGGTANAQNDDQQFFVAAERTVNKLREEFRAVMAGRDREILDQISFKIDKQSDNVFAVYATIRGGRRAIHISRGFLAVGDQLDWALAYELYVSRHSGALDGQRIARYTDALADTIRFNSSQRLLGRPGRPMPDYLIWSGQNTSQREVIVEQLRQDQAFQNLRALVKLNAFGLVMGHEIGHHVLGHLNTVGPSVADEKAADAYAMRLQIKAGYMPLVGFSSFMLFSALEGWSTETAVGEVRSHPKGVCRLYELVKTSLALIDSDKEFQDYLSQNGGKANFVALRNQLSGIKSQANAECAI